MFSQLCNRSNLYQLKHLNTLHSFNLTIVKRKQHQEQQLKDDILDGYEYEPRMDDEWLQAKPYESIPGPSRLRTFAHFMPGGMLYKTNLMDMNRIMREHYGDIYRIIGMFGKNDTIFTYNPQDIETTYRNDGAWPVRIGLESFSYYRKFKRPDVFGGIGGLVSEQGKTWADIRHKVNPVLMKQSNVRQSLSNIDEISMEFIDKLERLRDLENHTINCDFHKELKKWSFESISMVALNTRMGLLTDKPDQNALKLAKNMMDFFTYSFKYDIQPSIWQTYETPGFKRLLKTYDNITDITIKYIDAAIKKFEAEGNREAKSVLEKLCQIDRQVATVMAMDMLMAGSDTTTSAFLTILYQIAKNPEKQVILRRELMSVLPNLDSPLNKENTKNMPYLRACIKEGLRITSITPGNFRMATKDLVLSGYQVPRGTGVLMGVLVLANTEKYFPQSNVFMPERWLKSGEGACPHARPTNPFIYLPFGFGPRTCIGKRIAELEMEILLTRLLRRYKISWIGESDLKYISNIIIVPHGDIKFKFEPID